MHNRYTKTFNVPCLYVLSENKNQLRYMLALVLFLSTVNSMLGLEPPPFSEGTHSPVWVPPLSEAN